jgi:hypothetical protein
MSSGKSERNGLESASEFERFAGRVAEVRSDHGLVQSAEDSHKDQAPHRGTARLILAHGRFVCRFGLRRRFLADELSGLVAEER